MIRIWDNSENFDVLFVDNNITVTAISRDAFEELIRQGAQQLGWGLNEGGAIPSWGNQPQPPPFT